MTTLAESTYAQYFTALLSGNRSLCQTIVRNLLENQVTLKDLYLNVFQRSMYEIGTLWEQNRVSVATEHMATAITEHLMVLAYPQIFSVSRAGFKAVVSCAVDEYHQIGAKMVADILELHGWDTVFLGPNTPAPDLLKALNDHRPRLLCLSLSIYFRLAALMDLLTQVRKAFPALTIAIGGQAFRFGGRDIVERIPGIKIVETLDELEFFLGNLGS